MVDTQQPVTDAVLWRRVLDGDGPAFGDLFRRHAHAVYNHCFRRTASWSAAEDLTSITFLETWRRRRRVRLTAEGSLLPWLLAVANYATRNYQRSVRRHRRMLRKLPHEVATDPAEVAAARADAERAMRQILASLEHMSASERAVVELCVWAELSYADAAATLGVPVGTVRSRLARAREHLRQFAGSVDQSPSPSFEDETRGLRPPDVKRSES